MTHNVYHVDGKGVARHIEHILDIKGINVSSGCRAWVTITPIMQWIPFIKKIEAAGKSLLLDWCSNELEFFLLLPIILKELCFV